METISGKFCPVCKFKNDISATTCTYCGASLEVVRKGETTTRHVDKETRIFTSDDGAITKTGVIAPHKGFAVYLTNGILVETTEEKEFYLGRKSEESDAVFIDLVPFGAFQMGVSRQHALVQQTKRGYEIADLDSTNGTFLNGKRLVSRQAYALPQNAQVSLGRLHLLISYAKVNTKSRTTKS